MPKILSEKGKRAVKWVCVCVCVVAFLVLYGLTFYHILLLFVLVKYFYQKTVFLTLLCTL